MVIHTIIVEIFLDKSQWCQSSSGARRKVRDRQSLQASSSGGHECLNKIKSQSISFWPTERQPEIAIPRGMPPVWLKIKNNGR